MAHEAKKDACSSLLTVLYTELYFAINNNYKAM